jgi:hypothetical protein
MTTGGDAVLAVAYSQVGKTESPPNSNLCSPYTDPWGAGAWCAMFTSWCDAEAGYPYPAINGPAGLSYCPDGQVHAFTNGESVGAGGVQGGDSIIFSWEAWHMEGGIAVCSYGIYAGAPAGDHIGFFVEWIGGDYMRTVEGNTSQSSWDNGGAVMERGDRYAGQICCYWRPAAISAGGGGVTPPKEEEDDFMMRLVIQRGGGGKHGDGTNWAISPTTPMAWPISNPYTVSVMQAHGVLMRQEDMIAKGYTFETDGNSIYSTYVIGPILEAIPDA